METHHLCMLILKITNMCLENWLYTWERLPLFPRTWVRFPAPIWWQLTTACKAISGYLTLSSRPRWAADINLRYKHMCRENTHTNKSINK